MAVKSIIDIDVNDDAFKSFMDLFGKYQAAVKKLPGAWDQTGKSIDGAADSMADMTAAMLTQTELLSRQTRAQERMRGEVDKTNTAMTKLGRTTQGIAGNLMNISGHLLKWGGVGAAMGSLFSVAGAFGFGQLAHQANQNRMQSTGLGLSPGQLRAAEITYQNISGAPQALSYAADLKNNQSIRSQVAGLVSPGDIEGLSTTDLHERLLSSIRAQYMRAMRESPGTAAEQMQSFGATNVLGIEGIRQMAAISDEEWSSYGPAMRQRAEQIGGSNETNARYSEFLKRLETIGATLQTTLIDRLVVLAPSLEKVATAFGNLAKAALDSPQFKEGIESFAKFINDMADGKYREAFESFLNATKAVASGIWRVVNWLNADDKPRQSGDDPSLHTPGTPRRGSLGGRGNPAGGFYAPSSYGGQFGALEQGYNLPPGMLDAVYQIESGGGRNVGKSSAGALGPFQFMPATASAYGVNNPMDLGQSSRGAAAMLSDLMRQFGGDPLKAAAAYNWGSGNLSKAIAQHGSDWLSHAPKETQAYVNRLGGMIGGPSSLTAQPGQAVQVIIYDATGGNMVNIAAGLSAPRMAI
jgi:methyl-accepting chemotaxis protein